MADTAHKSPLGLWAKAHRWPTFPYGEDTTYELAAAFLGDLATVEDWGGGTAYFKKYLPLSLCIDGSPGTGVDIVDDLMKRESSPDGILLRHVLEHNWGWREVLANALRCARQRVALALYTPFVPETRSNGEIPLPGGSVPELCFNRAELEQCFGDWRFKLIRDLATRTAHSVEHFYYLWKP